MYQHFIHHLMEDQENWNEFKEFFVEKEIGARITLLNENEIARNIYFIKKGCLRIWFNNEGRDITLQFFFENQAVASIESFFSQKPSSFSIESIEPSTVMVFSKDSFDQIIQQNTLLKEQFQMFIFQRMKHYAGLFLSRIKDSPQKRYEELLRNNPEIVLRVPQHYIASYLGITPVSLSRIRNRRN